MDFTLSKEHEMARSLFKEFAEKEVKPLAQEVDETEAFPRETVEKMAKLGFLGIPVPKEYGGQGCDPLTYAMCVEELSKVCGTTGVIVSAHTSLCCDPIMTYGTEEQKQKYLTPLAKGEKLGAFALTEPGDRKPPIPPPVPPAPITTYFKWSMALRPPKFLKLCFIMHGMEGAVN